MDVPSAAKIRPPPNQRFVVTRKRVFRDAGTWVGHMG
jgi:hypothetical protein